MKHRSWIAGLSLALVAGTAGTALSNGSGERNDDGDWTLVHTESRYVTDGERIVTTMHDKGVLVERDLDARTLTLRRADDVLLTVAVLDRTRIYRNGDAVSLSQLTKGDVIKLFRLEREGDDRPRLLKVAAWEDAWSYGSHHDGDHR